MDVAPGADIAGRYRLERLLGEGGMGAVWSATHLVTQKSVALKFLKSRNNDATTVRRFLREARAASAVKHPGVVQIHDVLEHAGQPVMVMDLLSGETLAARLAREQSLSLSDFARIMVPIVSAVGSAHAAGIVHRDLKPENVFLNTLPEGEIDPKVLDFGIAKLSAVEGVAAATADLTSTGAVMGTPYYMAPEQVFGEKDLDHRADVWAMGVMSYECLAGVKPFDGANVGQLFKAVITGTLKPLETVAPQLPKDLTDAIGRLLRVDRAERAPDLRELYEILKRYANVDAASFGSARSLHVSRPSDSGAGTPVTPIAPVTPLASVTNIQPPLEKRRWLPAGIVAGAAVMSIAAWMATRPRALPPSETDAAASGAPSAEPAPEPVLGPSVVPAPVAQPDAGAPPKKPPIGRAPPPSKPSAASSVAPPPPKPEPTRVPGTPVEEVPF
jgi:serine/threonine-protein kinase